MSRTPPLFRRRLAVLVLAALAAVPAAQAQRFVPGSDPDMPRIQYADSMVSPNDRCIVAGGKLNLRVRPVYVNRAPIGFCCTECPRIFVQEPEQYLLLRDVKLPCAMVPRRPARIERALSAFVNYEVFFFSDSAALERFERNPAYWCGYITNPVTQVRFRPNARSPRMEHMERTFFFPNAADLERFAAHPDSFALRKGR